MDKKEFLGNIEEALRSRPGSVSEDDSLQNLDGWDSVGALSVMAVIDEKYGITLDAGELMSCQTVGDLARLVEKGR